MKNLQHFLFGISLLLTATIFAQVRYYASNRALNAINTYQVDGTLY